VNHAFPVRFLFVTAAVAMALDGVPATACGINEKGLAANLLYLAESDYGTPAASRPDLSSGGWAQYVLDSHATVAGSKAIA
jgi:penicillin V acylase-like amidase (Ntn superfamily)